MKKKLILHTKKKTALKKFTHALVTPYVYVIYAEIAEAIPLSNCPIEWKFFFFCQ